MAPVIVQEIVQGARDEAGRLHARCRWAGITRRSPHDCLIARIAIEHDVPLLHDDRDFELPAQVEPRLAWLRG